MIIQVNKEGRKRIETFSDYLKKVESLMPVNDKTLFHVDHENGAMLISAIANGLSGGNGVCDIKVDVTADASGSFAIDIKNLVKALKKVRSEDSKINVSQNKIVVSGQAGDKNSITLATLPPYTQKEMEEIQSYIDNELKLFTDTIVISTSDEAKKKLNIMMELTTVLADVNDSIEIGKEYIKAADNMNVTLMKVPVDSIVNIDGVILNRNMSQVIKHMSDLRTNKNGKFYIGSGSIGIRLLFEPKDPRYQFPNDEEIFMISPADDHHRELTINTSVFMDSIERFKGMFDSAVWKYEQVKIFTDNTDEVFLHFEDMACEVKEFIPCTRTQTFDGDIEFIFPTLYINKVKDLMSDTLIIRCNDLIPEGKEHDAAVVVKSGDITMITAKIMADIVK